MKRILLLFSFLILGFFSKAQNIDSVVTTLPISCNGGVGDMTVYTDATTNFLYDLLFLNPAGNWQTMIRAKHFIYSRFYIISFTWTNV